MTETSPPARPPGNPPSIPGRAAQADQHPAMIVRAAEPFNAGPPLALLCQSVVTPAELFYVRNHGNIPLVDADRYFLEVGREGQAPVRLSLAEVRACGPDVTVPATLQCAGNRRHELMAARPIEGELDWGPEAIGHAEWTGVRLGDVLRRAGIEPEAGGLHATFSGRDETERQGRRITFGGSIPLERAFEPDVLLAHTMNGQPLRPAHGFPLRVIVPGFIGARSVKWLERITVQAQPSDNYFQAHAYKLFAPHVTDETVNWDAGCMLEETPITSVIGSPQAGERLLGPEVVVRGYATAAGRRALVRVELSADGGDTWADVERLGPVQPGAWQLWQARISLPPGAHTLVVRAQDDGGNAQPAEVLPIWNFKGYMNNAWHRVNIEVGG